MKKIFQYILMAVALVATASCPHLTSDLLIKEIPARIAATCFLRQSSCKVIPRNGFVSI